MTGWENGPRIIDNESANVSEIFTQYADHSMEHVVGYWLLIFSTSLPITRSQKIGYCLKCGCIIKKIQYQLLPLDSYHLVI